MPEQTNAGQAGVGAGAGAGVGAGGGVEEQEQEQEQELVCLEEDTEEAVMKMEPFYHEDLAGLGLHTTPLSTKIGATGTNQAYNMFVDVRRVLLGFPLCATIWPASATRSKSSMAT
jgi:hypothetical protein